LLSTQNSAYRGRGREKGKSQMGGRGGEREASRKGLEKRKNGDCKGMEERNGKRREEWKTNLLSLVNKFVMDNKFVYYRKQICYR
jgi:hypothetical protein